METFNQDPKPGRLVLPLVLVGMIATTYTFVNRVATNNDLGVSVVEEEAVEVEEESTEDTTTTSTTTTTLPEEVVTYLETSSRKKLMKSGRSGARKNPLSSLSSPNKIMKEIA